MYEAKRIIGIAALAAAVSLGAILFSAVPTRSGLAAPTAADKATASPKVRALATSLAEEWLKEQGVAIPAAAALAGRPHGSCPEWTFSMARTAAR